MNAILDTLDTTEELERIWVTNKSSKQKTEVVTRANIKLISDNMSREVLKVLRVMGQAILIGVKELWTTRQRGTRLKPTPIREDATVTVLVPRSRRITEDHSKIGDDL